MVRVDENIRRNIVCRVDGFSSDSSIVCIVRSMIHYVTIENTTMKMAVESESREGAHGIAKAYIEDRLSPKVDTNTSKAHIHSFTIENESLHRQKFGNLGDYHGRIVE